MASVRALFVYNANMNSQQEPKLSHSTMPPLDSRGCREARLARDARYDGLFFVAVKTTGIFCRPICPAVAPKEKNVHYYREASQAAQAGYRPCFRCRPDSAPQSCAWAGTQTTLHRAMRLIDQGALQGGTLPELADRLGIGERYLRKLFEQNLGLSPKSYGLFQQLLFAKKLLHESALPISAVATAAGFNSVRRFNDAFAKQMQAKPSDIRRKKSLSPQIICLSLTYRPPFNWQAMLGYWQQRAITGVEWVNGEQYGRTFTYKSLVSKSVCKGHFSLRPMKDRNALELRIELDQADQLRQVLAHIRSALDLDADLSTIECHLAREPAMAKRLTPGLRIPGIWHPYEAAIRAILGQQVSIAAARTHLSLLVEGLGERDENDPQRLYFPSPKVVGNSELDMLKMPTRRRDTVREFSRWYAQASEEEQQNPEHWLALKGIGPWTVDYVKMRAFADPDIWLASDLGVKKALEKILQEAPNFSADALSPWRSYATFHLWRTLS